MKLGVKFQGLLDNLHFDNWPVLLLQRSLFRKQPLLVYRKRGITFLVDFAGQDECGTRMCLTSDMYSRYFRHFDKSRPLNVLDLGANGGGFPLSLLAAGFAFSRLVCVEMNANTFTRLSFNLHYNLRHCATALNVAIAGKNGTARISDNWGGTNECIYRESMPTEGNQVDVRLVTLDHLVTSYFGAGEQNWIDVCKMDIEGAEHEVFGSPDCKTIQRVKYLIMEIHPHEHLTGPDLIDRIVSSGFERITDEGPTEQNVFLFKNVRNCNQF